MHAYTIIDIQEVYIATNKGKKKERILKISNPWGKYEWKGISMSIEVVGRNILMFGANNYEEH